MSAESRRMTTIGQLIKDGTIIVHKDGNHGSNYPRANEFGENGVPFLSAKLLDDSGNIDFKGALRLNIEKAKKITFGYIETDDVLLSHNATVGRVAVVPKINEKVLIGTSLTHFRLNKEKLLPEYLAAFFSGKNFQNQLAAVMSQTTRNQVPITSQRNLSVYVPPIEDQRRIANTLGSFDKKIRLNTKTNQTLESIAQAIFKSWFVDFEPVKAKMATLAEGGTREQAELAAMGAISGKSEAELAQLQQQNPEHYQQLAETAALFPSAMVESELGEIPDGWEVKNIENILELAYGKSLGKTERTDGNIPVYGSGGLTGWHNKHLVNGPGIIVGRKGTVGSIYWEKNNFFPIDTVFYVTPKNGIPLIYTYYLLQILGLENMNTDAAVPGLNRNNAYRLETIFSSIELINAFSKIASSLQNEFDLLLEQSNQLSLLRDSLLPKLLSGELNLE